MSVYTTIHVCGSDPCSSSLLPVSPPLGPGLCPASLCSLKCHQGLNCHSAAGQGIGGLKPRWTCVLGHTEGQLSRLAQTTARAPRNNLVLFSLTLFLGPWEKVGQPGQFSLAGQVLHDLSCSQRLCSHPSPHILGAVLNYLASPVL